MFTLFLTLWSKSYLREQRDLKVVFLIMMLCCGEAFPTQTSIMGAGSTPALDYHKALLTKLSLRAPKCTMEENHNLWMENHNNLAETKHVEEKWKEFQIAGPEISGLNI